MTTIADIYGSYGLTQNATSDPYAEQESIITDAVKKQLADLSSVNRETSASKGFDTSFFDKGQMMKQEGDVLANLYSTFAQNRINDVNAEKNMNRNIVQNAAITETNTAAQSTLIAQQLEQNYRQTVGADAAASGIGTQQQALEQQKNLTQQQIDLQKADLLGKYTTTEGTFDTQKAKEFAAQFGLQEASVTGTYTDSQNNEVQTLSSKQLEQQKTINDEMLNYYATRDENSFKQLVGYTDPETNEVVKGTMQLQLEAQQAVIQKQYEVGELSANTSLTRQIDLNNANYDSQLKLFQDQYQYKIDNADPTMAQQFKNDMALLEKKLEIEKENAKTQLINTFGANLLSQGLNWLITGQANNFKLGNVGISV